MSDERLQTAGNVVRLAVVMGRLLSRTTGKSVPLANMEQNLLAVEARSRLRREPPQSMIEI